MALDEMAHDEGLHTCLDTSGRGGPEPFKALLPLVDLFHFDYKATDPQQHLEWAGVPLDPIVSNLWKLYERGADIVLRCPMIPGLNDTEEHFRAIQSCPPICRACKLRFCLITTWRAINGRGAAEKIHCHPSKTRAPKPKTVGSNKY